MDRNTWGFQFVKVNLAEDEFETLLSLNIGSEEKTRAIFNEIKSEFVINEGEPDCVIDLLDEEDSIVDDIPLTKGDIVEIAFRLGHKIQ